MNNILIFIMQVYYKFFDLYFNPQIKMVHCFKDHIVFQDTEHELWENML